VIRRWGKWYWGVRNDPKLRFRCEPEERWCWAALFDLALQKWAEGAEPGVVEFLPGQPYTETELAEEFGCHADVTQSALRKFEHLHMIERVGDRIVLVNFKKRQDDRNPEDPEDVRDRQRKYRESKKLRHANSHARVTQPSRKQSRKSNGLTTGEERRGEESKDPPFPPKGDEAQTGSRLTAANVLETLETSSRGRVATKPYDRGHCIAIQKHVIPQLEEQGTTLDHVKIAGEYVASWNSGARIDVKWLAQKGQLAGLIAKGLQWKAEHSRSQLGDAVAERNRRIAEREGLR